MGEEEVLIEGQEGSEQGDHASGGDTASKIPPGYVPISRLNKQSEQIRNLQASIKRYEELGRPEDLSVIKKKYEELSKGSTFTPSEKEVVRKEMLEAFPELRSMMSYVESRGKSYTQEGANRVNNYLKEINVEVSDQTNGWLQDLLAGVIARDQKLLERFGADDPRVFDDAWAVCKKTMFKGLGRSPAATVQSLKQPAKQPAQKKAEQKGEEALSERDVLGDAHDRAMAMLDSQEG